MTKAVLLISTAITIFTVTGLAASIRRHHSHDEPVAGLANFSMKLERKGESSRASHGANR
jgi:hypothetical protein